MHAMRSSGHVGRMIQAASPLHFISISSPAVSSLPNVETHQLKIFQSGRRAELTNSPVAVSLMARTRILRAALTQREADHQLFNFDEQFLWQRPSFPRIKSMFCAWKDHDLAAKSFPFWRLPLVRRGTFGERCRLVSRIELPRGYHTL
ncbi:hypothetical protein HBH56_097690 [Parastagonospora nodorum]|uniref:Uncharacterized protein n=1 Tax=Phaeosphaeria nodorum (strain SN15 / ATCC MYA-4574 / FGSC 10173) TaxID=321614 RepID=A0A7U2NR36_PHANO|nr:hypothetical protein HBH56_097690 [Parastagonospora nodorum]QRD07336.1 hypothetical protein JI435_447260 [Parastagonospora nodorum SN15]KAH3930212.1 hypothetical protein HBH54_112020 [Parastagonospora nodorum]KAH4050854.1 hypothetical protein HBH49_124180 [Parastagonospora nodorum]KAH4088533.1 hypothetical protein HBH46_196490 [Parastagonospora nodorum]